jgi:LmbE family N-acetylglucosaminyl deacetylase
MNEKFSKLKRFSYKLVFLLFLTSSLVFSQENFTILCAAAHPDDEDGATLAYYSKLKGYSAYTVFYTRGEGGQNEIGPELYDELGKIREQECINAANIQGSTPLFLGELDFGFSKTAKETFKFWGGEDSVLARIVYFIREIRPDIIISNHDTITIKPNRQHGNHQAVGITIFDAFDKAADPVYHPEQLVNGITPWQVKKLYFRTNDTSNSRKLVTIDIFQKDPVTGKTIGDLAIEALSQHMTQGMDKLDWKNIPEVAHKRRYELIRSDKDYSYDGGDLFSGLNKTEKLTDITPKSYNTLYSYRKLNPADSMKILNEVKYGKDINIGWINSYDNTIGDILNAFEIPHAVLDSTVLSQAVLSTFTTIIIDIRAYFYRKDLDANNNKILDYIKNGGNVVCFYHKNFDWDGHSYAPYPIYVTFERVTEENAHVTILDSDNYIFNKPNKIIPSDWNDWVQERNVYLPTDDTLKTSLKYEKLLAMNDEDDPVPSTSLLRAKYGKGTYIYCSLALYRQMKIFQEGSLKLFMNMISQNKSSN